MARYCTRCGSPVSESAAFCTECGAAMAPAQPAQPQPVYEQPAQPQYAQQPVQPQPVYEQPAQPQYPQQPVQPQPVYEQPAQPQYAQPYVQPQPVYEQPAQPQYAQPYVQPGYAQPVYAQQPVYAAPAPAPQKKKHVGLIVTLSVLGALTVLIAAAVIIAVLVFGAEKTDFDRYGIKIDLKEGETVSYTTVCNGDRTRKTTGEVTVTDYDRGELTDEMRAFARENGMDVDGCDVARVELKAVFDDDNAVDYGVYVMTTVVNKYEIKAFRDSRNIAVDTYGEEYSTFTVRYRDEQREVYFWNDSSWTYTDDGASVFQCTFTVIAPEGYDGVVVGVADAVHVINDDGEYIYDHYDENYHLFSVD